MIHVNEYLFELKVSWKMCNDLKGMAYELKKI